MRPISANQIQKKLQLFNPHWEAGGVDPELTKEKKRAYFNLFFQLVEKKVQRAIILMGPRRVGKTVLLWQTIQELIEQEKNPGDLFYLSMDAPLLHTYSLLDLIEIFQNRREGGSLENTVIIFDEIQYQKNWDQQLKILVDQFPKTKFIASGSAAGALSRQSQESGAGRFTDFLLPPLTFYEYLDLLDLLPELIPAGENNLLIPENLDQLNSEFIRYINYGGFPEAIFNEAIREDMGRFIRSDIIDKVLLKDLPSLYGIKDPQELYRLFTTLTYNTGCEVSLEGLSKTSGVAKNTLKRYIQYLEAALLIQIVRRVDQSGKKFQKENYFKVYLTNPSIYAAIHDPVSEDDLETLGLLTETAFVAQYLHSEALKSKIYYARWKGGKHEVDLVRVNESFKPIWALEVKWSNRFVNHPEELKNILLFARKAGLKKIWFTTKSIHSSETINNVLVNFWPTSFLSLEIGSGILEQKREILKDLVP